MVWRKQSDWCRRIRNESRRHEKIAQAVRQAVTAAGLSLYLNFGDANTVTVIRVPEGMKDTDIIRHMKETYGILISGSFDVHGRKGDPSGAYGK